MQPMTPLRCRLLFCLLLMVLAAGEAAVAANLRADDSAKLFKESVRPLFERKCFDCHSAKADEVKGNLKLETLESILKGGDQGPAIVAGDAENSFLVRALKYMVEDFQMPPSGRLPDE